MKLRRVSVTNARSFAEAAVLQVEGDISIIIGPNGGGKTNLLDTINNVLRRNILKAWTTNVHDYGQGNIQKHFALNEQVANYVIDKHSGLEDQPQVIEVDLEVGPRDLENMRSMKESSAMLLEYANKNLYMGHIFGSYQQWDLDNIHAGNVFRYVIVDNVIQPSPDVHSQHFLEYLSSFEIDRTIRLELGMGVLSIPILNMPVTRAAAGLNASVSLATYVDLEQKKQVDAANARNSASLVTLAVGRIAQKYRMMLEEGGDVKNRFYSDPLIAKLSSLLKDIGYEWELATTNVLHNQYDIRLKKQGKSFLVGSASSGEKELLTYLFGIYALNVRDALIVIDEPELHLHPKWQTTLLNLFERLATETGNQFILATHSSVFVSPVSIQYVSRVFSANQQSRIVRLDNKSLPDRKKMFSIVNSQNNERIFFTDKVILVEGISDRIFFEKLFYSHAKNSGDFGAYEVVGVTGKTFFEAYKAVLNASQINHVVIADRDYIADVGTDELRQLFSVNKPAIDRDTADPASKDGQSLVDRLEEAIGTGDLTDLRGLFDYIKSRRRKLRSDLSENEKMIFEEFINQKASEGVFILRRGSLEDYLPSGFKSKDLNKLIEFLDDPECFEKVPTEAKSELDEIVSQIFTGPSDRLDAQSTSPESVPIACS